MDKGIYHVEGNGKLKNIIKSKVFLTNKKTPVKNGECMKHFCSN